MCRLNMRAAVAAACLKMAAAVTWVKTDGVAAKEMIASDKRGSEDQDMAAGKLRGWHMQKRLTMAAAAEVWWHTATTPFDSLSNRVWPIRISQPSLNANQPV